METLLNFIPELALITTIMITWKLSAKIAINFNQQLIQLDLDKIYFVKTTDNFDENQNEFVIEVGYKGEVKTERTRIEKRIGTIFIGNFGFRFEDNLAVNRSETLNSQFTYTPSISFLPFVNEPWLINQKISNNNLQQLKRIMELFEDEEICKEKEKFLENIKYELKDFEKSVINHYKMCNNQSKIAQKKLKYDEKLHYKFAVMDHIFRSKYPIGEDSYVKLSVNNDNDYIFAVNNLLENRLIERRTIIYSDYKITKLGGKSHEFGFQEALDFKDRENEKNLLTDATLDMRKASITMKNATYFILATSVLSLIAQWENVKLIVSDLFF